MKHFEMASADKPEEIILATQRSMIHSMKGVIKDLREDLEKDGNKTPGLTWEQIDFLLNGFRDKKPEIVTQTGAM